ncbi:hypothetical protein LCGC14_2940900 [marine sediment metagenome]|uniref:SprT-like domain-containing protein n=1 Tax=marine sediment metagenome TaxID=412755 RepID=A0A0F9A950_9ZZZZ
MDAALAQIDSDMKKVRTHRFNGVKFHIGVDEPYVGWCDKPGRPDSTEYPGIRLPEGLPCGEKSGAKEGLITLIHEMLHAENWDPSEKRVDQIATDMGGLLWRLGYRRK